MTESKRWLGMVALLALAACGDAPEADESVQGAPAAQEEPAAVAPALDDAEIAHVAVTANEIDAEMGDLALTRAADERVKQFAQTMIRDHRGVNEQATALVTRLGVTPSENDVSRSLRADAAAARTGLEARSGAEFDRAYMEREVAYHRAVLDALDSTLIPGATNAELRALLEGARAAVATHLTHAEELSGSLGAAGAR